MTGDSNNIMLQVTKTFLPEFEKYVRLLERAWASGHITNYGNLARELEDALKARLDVKHLFLVSSGTIGLQLVIKAYGLNQQVITTPFSYVATTSSLVWEGCQPRFVDIRTDDLTIDADRIEAAITSQTQAILAVHVYGFPCDVERLEAIAKARGLKLIFDAAHAFSVDYGDKSVLHYGDASVLSFHATKLFHTVEGGAIVTNDDELAKKIDNMRHFGHKTQEEIWELGTNGKMSEMHAAMGLSVLPEVEAMIEQKKRTSLAYDELLKGSGLVFPGPRNGTKHNYAYYPIIFPNEQALVAAKKELEVQGVFPRRYFYPALNKLQYVDYQPMPLAESIAERILCLPLGHDVSEEDVLRISNIITSSLETI